MNRRLVIVCTAAVCLYMDSIFFPQVNILDVRPDMILVATVSFAILMGRMPGALFGGICGLLIDILTSRYVGLSAAIYLGAGYVAGFFYKKFYADNTIIPGAVAAVLALVKELIMALILFGSGARFSFAGMMGKYSLPCAVFTGLVCVGVHLVLRPLMSRQGRQGQSEKLSH